MVLASCRVRIPSSSSSCKALARAVSVIPCTLQSLPASRGRTRRSLQHFRKKWLDITSVCTDVPTTVATVCTEIVGVNRNTVNSWYNDFRHKIMLQVLAETRTESGEFEVDESYFGAHRVRGKRGRGAAGKTPAFGLLKRSGKVIVRIVPDCSKESLMPIILLPCA